VVDSAPSNVKEDISKDEAESIKTKLEEQGATVAEDLSPVRGTTCSWSLSTESVWIDGLQKNRLCSEPRR
jgi:hypothetical protein